MRMAEDTKERYQARLQRRIREFTLAWSEDMLYQMIEVVKNNPELTENNNKCRYLSKLMKDPDKFSYSPELISMDTHNKIESQKSDLRKIKDILGIKVSMPADILQEAMEKIIIHTEKKLTGYQKYAEKKAREYFTVREQNKPLNAQEKQEYLNKQYDLYEADRKTFAEIAKKIFEAYNPDKLKALIVKGLKENPQPGIISRFASGNIDGAALKIIRVLSEASGVNFEFSLKEQKPENKIMTFQEVKTRKTDKQDGLQSVKSILSGYIPHAENNPELLDYVAKNISLEG